MKIVDEIRERYSISRIQFAHGTKQRFHDKMVQENQSGMGIRVL